MPASAGIACGASQLGAPSDRPRSSSMLIISGLCVAIAEFAVA
jgi:hypothetical protein